MQTAEKRYSEKEYLARERVRDVRHEFVEGVEYAMAGASRAHSDLQQNLVVLLRAAVRSSGCNVGGPDQRVQPGARYYYPDLVGYCGSGNDDGFHTLRDARLIIEVLSAGTEAADRGEKFEAYASLQSLVEYVLVDSRRMRVERFLRQPDGSWRLDAFGPGASVHLTAFDVELSIDALYEGVTLEPALRLL